MLPPPHLARASRLMAALTWGVAPLLVVAGLVWARLGQVQGQVPLAVKGTFTEVLREGRTPYRLPGFSIHLEALTPDPMFRLRARGGEKGPDTFIEAQAGARGRIAGTDVAFEVEQVLPHALDQSQLRENPEAPANPALRVMLGIGAPTPLLGTLFARREDAQRRDAPGEAFAVLYQEAWDPKNLPQLKTRPAQAERLRLSYLGREVEAPVRLGETWNPQPFRIQVRQSFPDFVVRPNAAGLPEPGTKSSAPLDPWLELMLAGPDGAEKRVLLSALRPELTDALNAPNLPEGLSLRYVREGEERQRRFVVFTRADHQVRLVEQGVTQRTEPWVLNRPVLVAPGWSVTPIQAFEHAELVPAFIGHPDPQGEGRFEPQALRLKLVDGQGQVESLWFTPESEARAPFKGALRLEVATPPRLRAELTVRDAKGRESARQVLHSGEAMNYGGHRVTHAVNRPQALDAIHLQLSRNPGQWPQLVGCALALFGLLWSLLLEPRFARRRSS